MRYKVVPPVRSIAFLREASEQLPLVPGTVEDCCSRIRDGTDLQARDDAREYLTFCQALGLAAQTQEGYYRSRDQPDTDALAEAFVDHVYGVREVLDALDTEEARTVEAVFEATIAPMVPRWERDRSDDWRATWRERTERLLGWGVVFGLLAERTDSGYVRQQ